MKHIKDLVGDIYTLVDKGGDISDGLVESFAQSLAGIVKDRMKERPKGSYLRPSNIGEKCDRKLWYSVNRPELVEPLTPETKLKFLIGDIHEAVLLFLAEAAGHSVTGQQDVVSIGTVSGSRDAVIDGVLTDVKSASSRSFDKFVAGIKPGTDSFGYLKQLNFYLEASQEDDLVTNKEQAAFLASDKTLGKIVLDVHERAGIDYLKLIETKTKMLASSNVPARGYFPEPMGASGNEKLGVECAYCPFKRTCYPNLRTFIYSYGPVFLTTVKNEPRVPEAQ